MIVDFDLNSAGPKNKHTLINKNKLLLGGITALVAHRPTQQTGQPEGLSRVTFGKALHAASQLFEPWWGDDGRDNGKGVQGSRH